MPPAYADFLDVVTHRSELIRTLRKARSQWGIPAHLDLENPVLDSDTCKGCQERDRQGEQRPLVCDECGLTKTWRNRGRACGKKKDGNITRIHALRLLTKILNASHYGKFPQEATDMKVSFAKGSGLPRITIDGWAPKYDGTTTQWVRIPNVQWDFKVRPTPDKERLSGIRGDTYFSFADTKGNHGTKSKQAEGWEKFEHEWKAYLARTETPEEARRLLAQLEGPDAVSNLPEDNFHMNNALSCIRKGLDLDEKHPVADMASLMNGARTLVNTQRFEEARQKGLKTKEARKKSAKQRKLEDFNRMPMGGAAVQANQAGDDTHERSVDEVVPGPFLGPDELLGAGGGSSDEGSGGSSDEDNYDFEDGV